MAIASSSSSNTSATPQYVFIHVESNAIHSHMGSEEMVDPEVVQIDAWAPERQDADQKNFHSLIRPVRPISQSASQRSGISDEDLKTAATFSVVWEKFLSWLPQNTIYVGWEIYSGKRALEADLGRHKFKRPWFSSQDPKGVAADPKRKGHWYDMRWYLQSQRFKEFSTKPFKRIYPTPCLTWTAEEIVNCTVGGLSAGQRATAEKLAAAWEMQSKGKEQDQAKAIMCAQEGRGKKMKELLQDPKVNGEDDLTVALFDFEATGLPAKRQKFEDRPIFLAPDSDEAKKMRHEMGVKKDLWPGVTEVAAGCMWRDDEFEQKVNPGILISPEASRLTGITNEDVAHCPTWSVVGKDFNRFFMKISDLGRRKILLLAHWGNRFDHPLLRKEHERHQLSLPSNIVYGDTWDYFKRCFSEIRDIRDQIINPETGRPAFRMDYFRRVFKIHSGQAHRALTDIIDMKAVFKEAMSDGKGRTLTELQKKHVFQVWASGKSLRKWCKTEHEWGPHRAFTATAWYLKPHVDRAFAPAKVAWSSSSASSSNQRGQKRTRSDATTSSTSATSATLASIVDDESAKRQKN